MIHLLTDPAAWLALLTLTALELVLGIDNIIFISILVDKLPLEQRERTRRLGLFLAMFMRVCLLLALSWIMGLNAVLFTLFGAQVTGRDLILMTGGLFLVWKATKEVHQLTEGEEGSASQAVQSTFVAVLLQIVAIDAVFSLDSIITAVGMVDEVAIMVVAVVLSVALMLLFAKSIGDFVSRHPSIKMLALSFLLVIGVMLIAEGFGHKVPKGYIYFAMAFSLGVEMLNIRMRGRRSRPVHLREKYSADAEEQRAG